MDDIVKGLGMELAKVEHRFDVHRAVLGMSLARTAITYLSTRVLADGPADVLRAQFAASQVVDAEAVVKMEDALRSLRDAAFAVVDECVPYPSRNTPAMQQLRLVLDVQHGLANEELGK